jgi:hypothetical protein
MKLNMGLADRIIRVLVAVFFGLIYYTGLINNTWGIIFLIIGCILLATAIIGICPVYTLLGIDTRKIANGKQNRNENAKDSGQTIGNFLW